MLSTGAVQLLKTKAETDLFQSLGYPVYLLSLLAIWKILGVVAVLLPKFPLLKEWAYAGFFFTTSGAIFSHIAMAEPLTKTFPALLLLILTLVSWSNMTQNKKELSASGSEALLEVLKNRFEKNMQRHKDLIWHQVQAKLEANPEKLWILDQMEKSGGEPDVAGYDQKTSEFLFYDCSAESPSGRRSVCYDLEGLESRKEHRPENNAIDLAAAMGIEILTE
eukprot:gene14763-17892_t